MEPQTRKWLLTKLKAASKPVFLLLFSWSVVAFDAVSVSAVYNELNQLYVHTYPPFWISVPFRSPQSIKESPLSCAVGWVVLGRLFYVVSMMWVCQTQPPRSSRPPLSLLVSTCLPCTSASLFLLCKQDRLYQFCSDYTYMCINTWYFSSFLTWLYSVWRCLHKYSGILLNHRK